MHASAKTSGRCITQLVKTSIDPQKNSKQQLTYFITSL